MISKHGELRPNAQDDDQNNCGSLVRNFWPALVEPGQRRVWAQTVRIDFAPSVSGGIIHDHAPLQTLPYANPSRIRDQDTPETCAQIFYELVSQRLNKA